MGSPVTMHSNSGEASSLDGQEKRSTLPCNRCEKYAKQFIETEFKKKQLVKIHCNAKLLSYYAQWSVDLPQCWRGLGTGIKYYESLFIFKLVWINFFVDKGTLQITNWNISLSDVRCYFLECVIICVILAFHVIFHRAGKRDIAHKQQRYVVYKVNMMKWWHIRP